MRKERIFLILGVWVAILPYLGFPYLWKNVLFSLSGLCLIYFSFLLYRENRLPEDNIKNIDSFSENLRPEEKKVEPETGIESNNI
jgi:hypothetical protein